MSTSSTTATRLPLVRVATILFVSGFCSLIYQTVWLREFRLILGASTTASSAVLAIFMGGLGVGGWFIGKRTSGWALPFEQYAKIELAITGATAVTPFLLDLTRWLYLAAGGSSTLGPVSNTIVRLVLATLVIGPAVFFMGGTLPAAAQAITDDEDTGRRALAVLYGMNTLGAVTGVLAGTFFLFELYGFRTTLWLACLLNLGLGLASRATSRQLEREVVRPTARPVLVKHNAEDASDEEMKADTPDTPAQPAVAPAANTIPRPLVLLAAFTTGFVFLFIELIWYRMGSPILGGSTYTFGIILAMALLGIGVGGLIHDQAPASTEALPMRFATTCALQALLFMVPFAAGDKLALMAHYLHQLGASSFSMMVIGWTLIAGFMILPAALIAGYQFPLLFALRGEGSDHVGQDVGEIYAANTAGAVLGSLAGGFGLIPALGALGSWRFSAIAMVVLAVIVFATARRKQVGTGVLVTAFAALALMASATPGPSALWRHGAIGAGRFEIKGHDARAVEKAKRTSTMWFIEEVDGVESALGFQAQSGLSLMVNGKSDGNAITDAPTQIYLGLLPAILHKRPERAFVIGLGTGQTAGWLAEVDSMKHVDAVEIEPEVVRFSRLAASSNFNVADHKKVSIHIGDGREKLITSPHKYDIIVSEPSNPYRAGIASFYTHEFYSKARDKLNEGGIFAQWLQAYEIQHEAFAIVASTMLKSFKNVTVWRLGTGDLLLMASDHEIKLDVDQLRARQQQHPYKEAAVWLLGSTEPEAIAAMHIACPGLAQALTALELPINYDDTPHLEYMFARSVGQSSTSWLPGAILGASTRAGCKVGTTTGALDPALVSWLRGRTSIHQERLAPLQSFEPNPKNQTTRALLQAFLKGQPVTALLPQVLKDAPEQVRRDPLIKLIAYEDAVLRGDVAKLDALHAKLDKLAAQGRPVEAQWLHAIARIRQGQAEQGMTDALKALELMRQSPIFIPAMVKRSLLWFTPQTVPKARQDAWRRALLKAPFAVYVLESSRLGSSYLFLQQLDDDKSCLEAFDVFGKRIVWDQNMLEARLRCMERHRPAAAPAAREALQRFRAQQSTTLPELLQQVEAAHKARSSAPPRPRPPGARRPGE